MAEKYSLWIYVNRIYCSDSQKAHNNVGKQISFLGEIISGVREFNRGQQSPFLNDVCDEKNITLGAISLAILQFISGNGVLITDIEPQLPHIFKGEI